MRLKGPLSSSHDPHEYGLALGFAALLGLMFVIALIALHRLDADRQRLNQLEQEMVKSGLASEMQSYAKRRAEVLNQMILLPDPFDRDEQLMVFNDMAGHFLAACHRLLAMPLDADERAVLTRLRERIVLSAPLQRHVAALITANHLVDAKTFLIRVAKPTQERAMQQLIGLQRLEEKRATAHLVSATAEYQRSRVAMLTLSGIVLLFGTGIAMGVLRSKAKGDLALHTEKERALLTLEAIGDAVIRTDNAGRIEYLNPCAERMTGWGVTDANGRFAQDILHVTSDQNALEPVDLVREVQATHDSYLDLNQHTLIGCDGKRYFVNGNGVPIRDDEGQLNGAVIVLRDVTEMRVLSLELVYYATHDPMTGLINRREFENRLKAAIETTRVNGSSHVLSYLDLDSFKKVNDICGHLAGDELLRQIGILLHNAVGQHNSVARVGGDEFALLLMGCTLEEGARISDGIRRAIRDYRFTWDNKTFDISASIGVIGIGPTVGTLHDSLCAADEACQRAKAQGRNRVNVVDQAPQSANLRSDADWAETLSAALAKNQFVLYGQDVFPLQPAIAPSYCEILVRMQRQNGECVSTGTFLPAAERYHMMPSIDRWVIRETLSTLAMQTRDAEKKTTFNINLSGQSLCDPEFLGFVVHQFEETGVPPDRICFEITETAAICNMTSANRFMSRLTDIGCTFALDDFGSGLSSFGYLKKMPVRLLKIDGMFVRNISDDLVDRSMVQCINEMARVMGIETIAEYVESEAIAQELRTLGVSYGQGFFLARPIPLSEILNT